MVASSLSQKLMLEVETNVSKAMRDLAMLKKQFGSIPDQAPKMKQNFDKVSASAERSTRAIRNITLAVKSGKMPEEKAQIQIQKRIKLLEALRKQQNLTATQRANLDAALLSSAGASTRSAVSLNQTKKALKGVGGMSRSTTFAIGNLAETFTIARHGGYQMRFLMHQIVDSFMLLGPKGIAIAAAVAGVGLLSRAFMGAETAAVATKEEIEKFRASAVDEMRDLKTQIAKMEIGAMFEAMAEGPRKVYEQSRAMVEMFIKMEEGYQQQYHARQKEFTAKISELQKVQHGEMRDRIVQTHDLENITQAETERILKRLRNERLKHIQQEGTGESANRKRLALEKLINVQMGLKAQHEDENRKALKDSIETSNTKRIVLKKMDAIYPEIIKAQESYTEAIKGTTKEQAKAAKAGEGALKLSKELLERDRLTMGLRKQQEEIDDLRATRDYPDMLEEFGVDFESMGDDWAAFEKAKTDAAAKGKSDRERLALEEENKKKQIMRSAANFSSALIMETVKLSMAGEKYLGERLLAMFLERTGGQLVALGTRAIFEGGLETLSGSPTGPQKVALGIAALGAGVGMAASAGGISRGIASRESAGARRGQEGEGSEFAGSGGGISSRSPGGSTAPTTSGPTVINITYGIGGPLSAEDTAQSVLDAIELGRRRGLEGAF